MTTDFSQASPNRSQKRRDSVFLLITCLFLGTLLLINVLGLTRFVDFSFMFAGHTIPMIVPLGVLPYPVTFLCTDLISEFYGKQRAQQVVWLGLILNLWLLFLVWLGGLWPPAGIGTDFSALPPTTHPDFVFYKVRLLTMSGIIGSMVAYLCAQMLDVHLFHFWKRVTNGKHLWLRNNGSTLVSQLLDTIIVISIAFYLSDGQFFPVAERDLPTLGILIGSSYSFKVVLTLLDTIPFYCAVFYLRRYFGTATR